MLINQDEILSIVESDEDAGFCIDCGCRVDGIEPDARKYTCPDCGAIAVFGAQELLIAGYCEKGELEE